MAACRAGAVFVTLVSRRQSQFLSPSRKFSMKNIFVLICTLLFAASMALAQGPTPPKKLVLIAGKPSHPPRMHEFNAGVQLLSKCLRDVSAVKTEIVFNGWPKDEKVFDSADAVVFYMDGGAKHEVVQEGRRRLDMLDG